MEDLEWTSLLQKREKCKQRIRVNTDTERTQFKELRTALRKLEDTRIELVALDDQLRIQRQQTRSSGSMQYRMRSDADVNNRPTGSAPRSTARFSSSCAEPEQPFSARDKSRLWTKNPQSFLPPPGDSGLAETEWKQLLERRKLAKARFHRTQLLQRTEEPEKDNVPPSYRTLKEKHFSHRKNFLSAEKSELNSPDICESCNNATDSSLVYAKPSATLPPARLPPTLSSIGATIDQPSAGTGGGDLCQHSGFSRQLCFAKVSPVGSSPCSECSRILEDWLVPRSCHSAVILYLGPSLAASVQLFTSLGAEDRIACDSADLRVEGRFFRHRASLQNLGSASSLHAPRIQTCSTSTVMTGSEHQEPTSSASTSSLELEEDKENPASDSACESEYSEYEYTDASSTESEDSSSDSGLGSSDCSRRKLLKKKAPGLYSAAYYQEHVDPYSNRQLPDFSSTERGIGQQLREWIDYITSSSNSAVKDMQAKYGDLLPRCTKEPPSEPPIRFVSGDRNENREYHGEVEIHYENGDYFWGDMDHGSKEGMASVVLFNGDNHVGRFKNNQLDGFVQETIGFCDRDNVTREVFYKNGVRHGFYREFGPTKQFWCFGRYNNGEKVGIQWRMARGGVFNVGEVDEENRPYGEDNLFLYPDILTVLRGDYANGKLKKGVLARLTGMYKEYGVPVPETSFLEGATAFSYEPSSSQIITKTPMLRDPYEQRYVMVKESQVPFAGEGLYAKTDLKAGQLAAFFNGIRQRHLWGVKGENFAWSDYRIAVDRELDLDIRKEHESLKNYRATLGHKTCHSFKPNSYFSQVWHPRFGMIMSVVLSQDLKAGEEVMVSYNYDVQKAPVWYQEQWFKHLRGELNWTEAQVYGWAAKAVNKSGIPIKVPYPSRDSDRFVGCGECEEHVGLDCSSVSCESCEVWHHVECTAINLEEALNQGVQYSWTCRQCQHL